MSTHPNTELPIRVYYRISDFSQTTLNKSGEKIIKKRPDFFDKKICLLNFLDTFKHSEISILADNIGDETWSWLQQNCSNIEITRSNYGNGAASFRDVLSQALELDENRIVYFVEDDYLHLPNSETVLLEGFKYADYITLFDHPDKYINAGTGKSGVPGNPLISDESEVTRVYKTQSSHWKITNSSTMTFASSRDILRKDSKIIEFYTKGTFPRDYRLFRDLIDKVKRKLILPLPSLSTHCETAFLAPFRNWQSLSEQYKNQI